MHRRLCLAAAISILLLLPATGHAAAWLPQQTLGSGHDYGHGLTVAPNGEATVVYTDGGGFPVNSANVGVWAQQIAPGGTVGAQFQLSPAGEFSTHPRAAVAPDGAVTVVWHTPPANNDWMVKAVRIAPDGTVGPVHSLSAPAESSTSHSVAVAPDGSATVAWITETSPWAGRGEAWAVRIAPDGTVGTAVRLSAAGTDVEGLQIAIDPLARTTAVWCTTTGTVQSVQVAANGVAGAVADRANGATAHGLDVDVAADGTATVAWTSDVPATNDAVKSRQISPTGVAGPTQTLIGSGVLYGLNLAVAEDGTANVVWERRLVPASTYAVESVRVAPTGVPGAVQTVSPAATSAWHPFIETAPNGRSHVLWDERTGRAEIGNEISAAGTIGPAVRVFDDPAYFSSQAIVAFDAAGNATALTLNQLGADDRFDVAYHDAQAPWFKQLTLPARVPPGARFGAFALADDNRSGIASMAWDWGDNSTSVGPAPTHTYTRPGTYLVRITVTDNAGNSSSKTRVVVVS